MPVYIRRPVPYCALKVKSLLAHSLNPSVGEEYRIVKAADKLSAYLKCLEELRSGNNEFVKAEKSICAALHEKNMRCVEYFFEHFIPSFSLTLDELEGL